ncbi:MAG TPA: cytochrome c/FTR1 family iron permease [Verrucomicrobiae bacterium]|nr:cytochrome c/FTR1 family iron permease [Verrucomicrobiae bacterium]
MAAALAVLCLVASAPARADDVANRLVALLDYVGGDYKNAVQNGRVANESEYREMKEFAARIVELGAQLNTDKPAIEPELKRIAAAIERKADADEVGRLAQGVKQNLIAQYGIATSPRRMPTLAAGKKVFAENCAECHGQAGRGDGPARATMNPKEPPPANFTDAELMEGLSPFKAFNVASFGIEGTAMPNFSALTDEERWQAAFYVFALRFGDPASAEGAALARGKLPSQLTELATLSTSTDGELLDRLKSIYPQEGDSPKVLAYLRRGLLEESRTAGPLIAAQTLLKESLALYENGDKEKAYQKAAEAYLDGFEQAEAQLFAKDLSFGRGIEDQFTQFRNSIRRGDDVREIRRQYSEITAGLDRAGKLLARQDSLNPTYLFINALLIIVREGLEVALILAAILALLKVMGATRAMRYIHLGWIAAVFAGLATWLAAQTFLNLTGSHREAIEGFTTLFAALVLFYVGYWLHTKSEAKKWQAFIRGKVQGALSGERLLALAGVSFFAAYREAFEVVLFYQALWLQSESNPKPVVTGFITGVALLCVIVVVLFKLGLKIPIKYFFATTGLLLYLLALVFAGQGVRELQATGWFSVTPLRFPPQVSALGIYPTVETLLAQAVVLIALIATMLWPYRARFGEAKGKPREAL